MKKYIVLVIALLLLACSEVSSPNEISKYEIEEILGNIEDDFNFADLQGIMSYYHEDFSHNQTNYWEEETIWQLRLTDYNMIEFENIEIELNLPLASASFTMKLTNENGTDSFQEPEDHGDISYFYRENGVWKIYGNQAIN